jgi:hypothetical protein
MLPEILQTSLGGWDNWKQRSMRTQVPVTGHHGRMFQMVQKQFGCQLSQESDFSANWLQNRLEIFNFREMTGNFRSLPQCHHQDNKRHHFDNTPSNLMRNQFTA